MNIQTAITKYLEQLESEGRSPHTVTAYRRDLAVFAAFAGDTVIEAVTPQLLTAFMASESVQFRPCGTQRAKATVNRYRVALKALFAWASDRWLITRNPTSILRCKRHRGLPPVILTVEEVESVVTFDYSGKHATRDRALLTFMVETGCRLSETVALDWNDIDLAAGTSVLMCPKGGEPDRIHLSKRTATAFEALGENRKGPVFTSSRGRRLSTRHVQRIVAARTIEASIDKPVTPHTLRHTFATRLYNQTGDIRLVQLALRHEHVTTTERYAQIDPKRLRAAVGADATTP